MASSAERRTSRISEIGALGQSVWFNDIRRSLLTSGEFEQMVREDGLSGVTSNPSIFEKAIVDSTDCDDALAQAQAASVSDGMTADPRTVYEGLAIADLRQAADLLRGVYEDTDAGDRYVSMEAAPDLAHYTVRHGRGGATVMGGRRPIESDDQGSRHCRGYPGDPAADRSGHQHEHHAAVLHPRARTGVPAQVRSHDAVAEARQEFDTLREGRGYDNVRSMQRANRHLVSEQAGVIRNDEGLRAGLAKARALARTDTRAAHHRSDYPAVDPTLKVNMVWLRDALPAQEPVVDTPEEIARLIPSVDDSVVGKIVE